MTGPYGSTSMIVSPDGARERGAGLRRPASRVVRARYDAAKTTQDNARLWADVDGMSARFANSPDVRYRLRTRARYERGNNSYVRGMTRVLARDLVGRVPRLQLRGADRDFLSGVELAFRAWSKSVRLGVKLRTMRESLAVDGEAFLVFVTNPRLPGPVKLDLHLIEADQFATPWLNPIDPLAVDGIRYDEHGNPVEYSLLRSHPGDSYQHGLIADPIDARNVIHWFRLERPGQCRGVPEITPAIPIFSQLRRYTLSVLRASEVAADFSLMLETDLPPDEEDEEALPPFDTQDIEMGMMTALPAGTKANQLKAEQPVSTYEMIKRELINEVAVCLNIPYNVAAGNSMNYNYASGRLDHQEYHRTVDVDRQELLIDGTLDPVFARWVEEAATTSLVPRAMRDVELWERAWYFDGFEHVDPEKEANAQETKLRNHTTTLSDEYAERGLDWEDQVRQRAREINLMTELGLDQGQKPTAPKQPAPVDKGEGNGQIKNGRFSVR